ncbi:DEAD/DEAH box helicase family protein [Streptosporangiaceae bacterium NEAU-GS5]|nr:DEAD/DEAH box helicase family protein [Streptosporangiaceae bacterium NEAU-GS5]
MHGATRPPYALRPHQAAALDGLERAFTAGRRRAWVVLPPGAGKTLTGLEAARRLGHPMVAFAPNTAIQGQWAREWRAFGGTAGVGRELSDAGFNVLTYQALASFDPEAEVDEDGAETGSPLDRLRPSGRELVERLRARGRLTVLLDECHHLLDTWGELLAEVLEGLPDAVVIGLTATPPDRLTAAQAALVDKLFGPVVAGPSIPAVVREGDLAPFAELAWLTTPTPVEAGWLAAEAERFAELTTDLLDPAFAPVPFLTWLDERLVRHDGITWARLERERPELTTAALRFHHAGLLALPDEARLREEHRQPPGAGDWVALLDDYVIRCLRPGGHESAVAAIRTALPSVGYQLTARGVRGGRSPVDRVLARSAAKTSAVVEILAAEAASLGDRLRAVVICDYENAAATVPARLSGVLADEAGSARLVLEELVRDPRTAVLAPLLVTGRTVAGSAEGARAFADTCTENLTFTDAGDGVAELTGRWTSRTWVARATRFFEDGGSRVLVGTRAMLGEGWDARGVNTLVDLTEATTATSVVQTRGRGLRIDPAWPDKVANTWSVVCVAAGHPKGAADWQRFVRKHDGYYGVTDAGEIMAGVSHVHPALSPYAPPPEADFGAFNATMLIRAAERHRVRALWRVGEPYADRLVHTLRVIPTDGGGRFAVTLRTAGAPAESGRRPAADRRRGPAPRPPAVVAGAHGVAPAPEVGVWPSVAAGVGVMTACLVAGLMLPLAFAGGLLCGWAVREARRALIGARVLRDTSHDPDLGAMACALADALRAAGLAPRGSEAVAVEPDETGAYRIEMDGVPPEASSCFAIAFDELVSPLGDPRYVLPRHFLTARGPLAGWRLMTRRGEPNPVVYHAVPAVLGGHRRHADLLAREWARWVSGGEPLYTRGPEGAGVLAAQRGGSPMDVTTAMRATWM